MCLSEIRITTIRIYIDVPMSISQNEPHGAQGPNMIPHLSLYSVVLHFDKKQPCVK